MSLNPQPITGREAFWGDIRPTQSQLDLINRSPTFVAQIRQADAQVKMGQCQPMAVKDVAGPVYQTDNGQIQFPSRYTNDPMRMSWAIWPMRWDISCMRVRTRHSRRNTRPILATPTLSTPRRCCRSVPRREAQLNHWKIYHEILRNTTTPDHPGTGIDGHLDPQLVQLFDEHYAKYAQAGLTEKQIDQRLIVSGMPNTAVGTAEGSDSTYNYYGHLLTGGAPTEPGSPTSVSYGQDDIGNLTSATQAWRTGDVTTQTYTNGNLQSVRTVDPDGKLLSVSAYAYNPGGSCSVEMSRGERAIRQSGFDAEVPASSAVLIRMAHGKRRYSTPGTRRGR
jgi:hypothetical protein